MIQAATLIDIPTEPVHDLSARIAIEIVFLVMAAMVLVAVGLGLFLWFRKRRLRHHEMIRHDPEPAFGSQLNQPNQP